METRIEIRIPEGRTCLGGNMKPCILARYTKKWDAYNCQLYHRILKGERIPKKCKECLEHCEKKGEQNHEEDIQIRS